MHLSGGLVLLGAADVIEPRVFVSVLVVNIGWGGGMVVRVMWDLLSLVRTLTD